MHSLLPILLCSFLLASVANADNPFYTGCPNNTNYTRGSAFQANLNALLASLPSAAAASAGFATNTTGTAPDQAYGLAQCRADVNASDCGACLDGSTRDMARVCPGQKSAMLIYDACQLRHSNASFFGAVDASVVVWQPNAQNATQQEQFTTRLGALMGSVTEKAAYASPRRFAVGSAAVTPFVNVYGMAQCTRDLAGDDCNRCLVGAVSFIPTCCDGRQGARIVYPSCSIRFEVYPFYDAQAADAAMSPAPAPGAGSVNGSDQSGLGESGESMVSTPVTFLTAAAAGTRRHGAGVLFVSKMDKNGYLNLEVDSTGDFVSKRLVD
jgi:hypothetical protein